MMQFEWLANEVLLDLFDYFDAVHLLSAFFGLNSRFDTLLYKHYRAYHLNLRRVSKRHFDTLCQQHFPSIIDRIVSLHMAHEDETPGLLKVFLSRGFHINQFTNLRSLTLHGIYSADIMEVLGELNHLVYLNISKCSISFERPDRPPLINQIWNLPKLRHCKLDHCYRSGIYFNEETVVSSNLENLSICNAMQPVKSSDLVYLLVCTPRLRVLSMLVESVNENEKLPIVVASITTLNLMFWGEARALKNLFQNVPYLRHLTIEMVGSDLNGHAWKQIIVKYLSKLKTFRFKMSVGPYDIYITEQRVEELLNTFRTPFWLEDHQWYVRCDWGEGSDFRTAYACLYSLPYAFGLYTETTEGVKESKWTCPDDKKYWSFDRVHKFNWRSSRNECMYLYPAFFPNIHKLYTRLPLSETIWNIIPTLDHLVKLYICPLKEDSESIFQALLDRAPHLYTLTTDLCSKLSNIEVLFKLTSVSVRQFRINPFPKHPHFDFNDAQCKAFARSPLAVRCEYLEIRIRFQDSIVKLVNSMDNLRAMTIHLTDNMHVQPRRTEAELIEWTKNYLPTKYWVSSYANSGIAFVMKIWIDDD